MEAVTLLLFAGIGFIFYSMVKKKSTQAPNTNLPTTDPAMITPIQPSEPTTNYTTNNQIPDVTNLIPDTSVPNNAQTIIDYTDPNEVDLTSNTSKLITDEFPTTDITVPIPILTQQRNIMYSSPFYLKHYATEDLAQQAINTQQPYTTEGVVFDETNKIPIFSVNWIIGGLTTAGDYYVKTLVKTIGYK